MGWSGGQPTDLQICQNQFDHIKTYTDVIIQTLEHINSSSILVKNNISPKLDPIFEHPSVA